MSFDWDNWGLKEYITMFIIIMAMVAIYSVTTVIIF